MGFPFTIPLIHLVWMGFSSTRHKRFKHPQSGQLTRRPSPARLVDAQGAGHRGPGRLEAREAQVLPVPGGVPVVAVVGGPELACGDMHQELSPPPEASLPVFAEQANFRATKQPWEAEQASQGSVCLLAAMNFINQHCQAQSQTLQGAQVGARPLDPGRHAVDLGSVVLRGTKLHLGAMCDGSSWQGHLSRLRRA